MMNNLRENAGAMRVVFERNANAKFYKAKYERNGVG
jgi:hypothetical protein